jgi:hypothetical protein
MRNGTDVVTDYGQVGMFTRQHEIQQRREKDLPKVIRAAMGVIRSAQIAFEEIITDRISGREETVLANPYTGFQNFQEKPHSVSSKGNCPKSKPEQGVEVTGKKQQPARRN